MMPIQSAKSQGPTRWWGVISHKQIFSKGLSRSEIVRPGWLFAGIYRVNSFYRACFFCLPILQPGELGAKSDGSGVSFILGMRFL